MVTFNTHHRTLSQCHRTGPTVLDARHRARWHPDISISAYIQSVHTTPRDAVLDLRQITRSLTQYDGVAVFDSCRFHVHVLDQVWTVRCGPEQTSILNIMFNPMNRSSYVATLGISATMLYQDIAHTGRFLMRLVDHLNVVMGVELSELYDGSYKTICDGTFVTLAPLLMLAHGRTWYMQHGFMTTDDMRWRQLLEARPKFIVDVYGKPDALDVLQLSGLVVQDPVAYLTTTRLDDFFNPFIHRPSYGKSCLC